jgi:lipoprotein-releasing system permease protein
MWLSWQPFEWIVALRFLREGRLQTVFIISGVAIGVGVIVFMSAVLAGMQANFIRRVLSAQAHIQLLPPKEVTRALRPTESPWAALGGPVVGAPKPAEPSLGVPDRETADDAAADAQGGERALVGAIIQPPLQRLRSIDQWQAVAAQTQALGAVAVVSPIASGSALLTRGSASRAVTLLGVDLQAHDRIIDLRGKMLRGEARLGANELLIGLDLATDLAVDVGDKLTLSTARGAQSIATVAGVFDLGNKGANSRNAFVALHTAQSLFGLPGGVSVLDLTVFDVYAAERIAQRIAQQHPVQAESWIKTSAQFFTAISAQTTANRAIRFFVGLSVAFGIASVLVVSVVQKSREIGILRAMGITQAQVLRVFLLQGALLGLGGSVVGNALGAVSLILWQRWVRNPDGTPLFPLVLDPVIFTTALGLASATGLLAAVAPALRAARLDPVVAIRG